MKGKKKKLQKRQESLSVRTDNCVGLVFKLGLYTPSNGREKKECFNNVFIKVLLSKLVKTKRFNLQK